MEAAARRTSQMAVDPATFRIGDVKKEIKASLGSGYQAALGTPPSIVATTLLENNGTPVGGTHFALPDKDGKLVFDYTQELGTTTGSYILRVISPSSVRCDQRIEVTA